MKARRTGGDTSAMVAQFDHLEEQANHLRIPVAYASMLLWFAGERIDVVRERLQKQPTR